MLGFSEIRSRATTFAYEWREANYEMGQSQSFWLDFFTCFGISPKRVATFEERVKKLGGKTGRIDMLWKGVLLIEQKSRGQDLEKAHKQALEYFPGLADHELPQYVLVCDFYNFHLHDVAKGTEVRLTLPELPSKVELFGFMIGQTKERPTDYEKVSIEAAQKMAALHDSFKAIGYGGEELQTYLVRLLFCLFADDTGIFDKNIFYDLIESTREDGSDLAETLDGLFVRLNTPEHRRLKIEDRFTHFPYINGDLFDTRLPNAAFDKKMRHILLSSCNFDWGHITPSIFGSLFQAVMTLEERRAMGAHYTEEANILKVINPLFMDGLRSEFELARNDSKKLGQFHDKLAKLTFLDPACGTGNFLIIAYRELRNLELEVLEAKHSKDFTQGKLDAAEFSKINVDQFHGIEIDPLAVEIAKVGMWLADHQCNNALSGRFGRYYVRLPLTTRAKIIHANALKTDWPVTDYILGNPPFVGARLMTKGQKDDLTSVIVDSGNRPVRNSGNVDYVAGWYYKASQSMHKNITTRTALVSTNSITQGEQTATIWQTLMQDYGMKIGFAYRTFRWTSQARGKAAVHCVIVGFGNREAIDKPVGDGRREAIDKPAGFGSIETIDKLSGKIGKTESPSTKSIPRNAKSRGGFQSPDIDSSSPHMFPATKVIYDGELVLPANNINAYLVDAANVFISSRKTPLCDVPEMVFGNMPNDNGNFLFNDNEKFEFTSKEPSSEKWFRKIVGSQEFINSISRWCLWLEGISPGELKNLPMVNERVKNVRELRLKSTREATRKLADFPARFGEVRHPDGDYLLIPRVSSENRMYIPIGFMSKNVITSDSALIIPGATLYHFGVLTSNIHMAWVRAVCGRLESRYRYSANIVYNNFPWPSPSDKQKEAISKAAQAVLDARSLFPKDSLATLYDPSLTPDALAKAHRELDRTVAKAYGDKGFATEGERVADLMERYRELVN